MAANDHLGRQFEDEEPFGPQDMVSDKDKAWARRERVQKDLEAGGYTPAPYRTTGEDVSLSGSPYERSRLKKEMRAQDEPFKEAYESGIEEGKAQVTQREVKKALKAQRQQKRTVRDVQRTAANLSRLARIAKGRRR
jgi:hypothetical protein